MSYLFRIRPHKVKYMIYLETINESTLLLYLIASYSFTDFFSDGKTRYNIGWALVGLVSLNLTIGLGFLIHKVYKNLKKNIKSAIKYIKENWCNKKKTTISKTVSIKGSNQSLFTMDS